jgi:hypothetical protein
VRTVAFVADLMDRSRLAGSFASLDFATEAGAAAGADVVLVDLARYAALVAPIRAAVPDARIVAFGPHVDTATLDRAAADGADAALARSQFFRDPAAAARGVG